MIENICTHGYNQNECTLCPDTDRAASEYRRIKMIPNRTDRCLEVARLEKDPTFGKFARKWFNNYCDSQGLYVPHVRV